MHFNFSLISPFIKNILSSVFTALITAIFLIPITIVLTKSCEKAGEPKVKTNIGEFVILQSLEQKYCKGEMVLLISNLENKPTFLKLDTISILILSLDSREFKIAVNKRLPLNAFENRSDTIFFDLSDRVVLDTIKVVSPKLITRANLLYPNNKIAAQVKIDTLTPLINFHFVWPKPPDKFFYYIREEYKKNNLTKDWKTIDVRYFGNVYDCYYCLKDDEIKIGYVGDLLNVIPLKEEFIKIDTFNDRIRNDYIFLPHPKIEHKFINIDNMNFKIENELRGKTVNIVNKYVNVKRGYMSLFYIPI